MIHSKKHILAFTLLVLTTFFMTSCEKNIDDLDEATYPTDPLVFIDDFSGGLDFAAFAGSDVYAFDVDKEVSFEGSASMKFAVPNAGDANGGYAGGVFYTSIGRDLTSYDVLSFWAKASQAADLDIIGFGNDLDELKYQASIRDVALNTNWKKYYIPIPNAKKLTNERGLLYFSEAPENGKGYTFWLDEVKFENLGTFAHTKGNIFNGEDFARASENGAVIPINDTYVNFNLPTGVDQSVDAAPAYFDFISSNPSVASIDDSGNITVLESGTTAISATLQGMKANGSLYLTSIGDAILPESTAPIPSVPADSVISLYSDVYIDVPVDLWNTYWEFSTATDFEVQVNGDNMRRYQNLNFVGIEFTSQTIDVSEMTHFHLDLWTAEATDLPAAFKILLVDFGADNTFDGGDDSSHELSFTSPLLQSESWVSIDVPISSFAGLVNTSNLAQMVLSGDLPTVFIDNVYFYNAGEVMNTVPEEAAPEPMHDESDVISVYSNTYTNISGTNFNPDWGQSTVVTDVLIDGNNTLLYTGLNYQGVELQGSLDASNMTHLHIDYWSANSTALNTFLVSSGPVEKAKVLGVPTSGWTSIDIPLGDFDTLDLADIIQFKFDGNGDIYLDNIYFYK